MKDCLPLKSYPKYWVTNTEYYVYVEEEKGNMRMGGGGNWSHPEYLAKSEYVKDFTISKQMFRVEPCWGYGEESVAL